MRFALINGKRAEATKGAKGTCKECGSELIARCGEVNVNHWAHKGKHNCDTRWENQGPWHRSWKDKFPNDWQEVTDYDDSGEKHIADVKTESGWVLEFQHSYLKPEERRSRNAFYPKLVWVVDGLRRKTDIAQFSKIIKKSTVVSADPPIRRVNSPEDCKLLKEWHDSKTLVFFDFEPQETEEALLYFVYPTISTTEAYISACSRDEFIKLHNENEFEKFISNIILTTHTILTGNKQIKHENNVDSRSNRESLLDRHPASVQRRRRRF